MTKFELIACMDSNGGIGKNNKLPWKNAEELKLFKEKTMGSTLVVGRKTFSYLPALPGRKVYCLSRFIKAEFTYIRNIEDVPYPDGGKVFIAGGAEVYRYALERKLVSRIHLSIIDGEYKCDTYFPRKFLREFVITSKEEREGFTHYVLDYDPGVETQYLETLCRVLNEGCEKEGRNGVTRSLFSCNFRADLRKGFPLLTTKKMFTRGVIEEFLFFIRGDTNSKKLEEKNVNIWKGNTSREFLDSNGFTNFEEGMMGPMYGYQFRNFNAPYNELTGRPIIPEEGTDQLAIVIAQLRTNPNSRRILMTSYNPAQALEGVLYPCHSITLQFYVEDGMLDMFAYSRSADMFLGVPFNIAYYALLLSTIAKISFLTPRMLNIQTGDTHIYKDHYDAVATQLLRIPHKLPTLTLPDDLDSIEKLENMEAADFVIEGYTSEPRIKAKMVA